MIKGNSRISKALTNISILYQNEDYIADKVLPSINIVKDSDQYWIHNNGFKLPQTLRANGTPSNMENYDMSASTYVVQNHALKDVITDDDYQNTEAPLNLDKDITNYLTDKILLRREYETHKLLFTTTTFSNNATLTSASSWKYHTTTSAPIQNGLSATTKIIESSGKMPNTMVISRAVLDAIKENPNVYGRIQYVQKSILSKDIIASLFEVDNCYVGTAALDAAQEGETVDQSILWGADALFAYMSPRPTLRDASAAVMFNVASKGIPFRVKKWYEDDIEGNYIEVQSKFVPKALATSSGYLYKAVAL